MKGSRFKDSQIVSILKEADVGTKVKDLWTALKTGWKNAHTRLVYGFLLTSTASMRQTMPG
jgi:hypothetical protein